MESKAPVEWSQHFGATYPNIVVCCWLTFDHFQNWANNTQYFATRRNRVVKCVQHFAPNNVTIASKCCNVILVATKKWKILNKRYLWKYWSSVLETWHHKCASKKKQNDTLNAVAIATLLAPVSLGQKSKYPHLQSLKWAKGSYLEQT